MTPSTFLVKLDPRPALGENVFQATVIADAPEVPPDLPPPDAKFTWIPTPEGWIGAYGPLPKPHPLPPGFEDSQGKWVQFPNGIYFVVGPYDKPRPPGPIDPEPPIDPGNPPDEVEGRWVYTPAGWVWVLGPFAGGKPQPIP